MSELNIQSKGTDLVLKNIVKVHKGSRRDLLKLSSEFNVPFSAILEDTYENTQIIKPLWHIGDGIFVDAIGTIIEF